ncbi:hypothetical protein TNCV_4544481 [Trichonephila clavipes]|nr:hypothetical protein TNCV_4544481 [Trichonephila clavipes]
MSTPLPESPFLQNTTTTSNTILSTSQDAKQTSKPLDDNACSYKTFAVEEFLENGISTERISACYPD